MSDRLEELKGRARGGVGRVTGDRRLVSDGETQAEAAKSKRENKGALREAAGTVQEGLGMLTGNEQTKAEGKANRLRGKRDQAG